MRRCWWPRWDAQEGDLTGARGLLAGTVQRLTNFSKTAHGKQLIYLAVFVFVVFMVIYFMIR